MDWSGCKMVETYAGQFLLRGTTIAPEAVLEAWVSGHSRAEMSGLFPTISPEVIDDLLDYGAQRLGMDQETEWDWRRCDLVEQVPGRCSGAWTVKGTRIFADTVPAAYDLGGSVEEILEDYPSLSEATVRGLIEHAARQDARAA